MGNRSYRPIMEASVDVVVVELEAMVVAMYITKNRIGSIRLAIGVSEKAIPNGLARSKAQEKKMKLKMTTTSQVDPINPVRKFIQVIQTEEKDEEVVHYNKDSDLRTGRSV